MGISPLINQRTIMNRIFSLALAFFCVGSGLAQQTQYGPYTVYDLAENVYRIEDSNDSNPPGVTVGDDGQVTRMNNCSDMYLIVGGEMGLLIDLSNKLEMNDETIESLRSLVFERLEGRKLIVTVTHRHGDHLGMLPVFVDDTAVTFLVPGNEFRGTDLFPRERTGYFIQTGSTLDLGGGMIIIPMEVPGHTSHSTIFFLKGKNMVFTGDAIGSGSGVWLFNEESFFTYDHAIDDLIDYIENPDNQVDKDKLRIYGGHYWQGTEVGELSAQYIYDMRTLIDNMKAGKVETEAMSSPMSFLDTNFKYGTATITWNKEAAKKLLNTPKGD
jgi:glyoxylase-like metal-dependent hydrolase (beta-lactamase superfamily II)